MCPFGTSSRCPECKSRILAPLRGRNVHFWHVLALSRGQMSHFGVSQRAKSALLARLGAFQRADVAFWRLPEGEKCTFGAFPECDWTRLLFRTTRILVSPTV